MYRFELGNSRVECDTAEELTTALGGTATATKPRASATASATATEEAEPTGKKRGRRKLSGQKKSWELAQKEAERQGRTDVAKVRSEMATARKAGGEPKAKGTRGRKAK